MSKLENHLKRGENKKRKDKKKEEINMIITAMYLYGIIQHAWSFSIWHMLATFIMDIILVHLLSPDIEIINKISDEERDYFKEKVIYLKEKVNYFRKKWEVEELNRKILDKQLYG